MSIRRFGIIPKIEDFEELIYACRENNVIFEVNLRYHDAIIEDLIFLLKNLKQNGL